MLPPEPGLTGVRGKKQPGVERRSFAVLTQPATIQLAVDQENPWFEVTLSEGRNRQIRRMFEQIGYHIEKIKRVRYGSLTLDLEPGEFRHLTPKEVNQLRKSLDTPFKPKPIKVKRKDERPERKPRTDTARFVKGRRGKPSADAPLLLLRSPRLRTFLHALPLPVRRAPPARLRRAAPAPRAARLRRLGTSLRPRIVASAAALPVRVGRSSAEASYATLALSPSAPTYASPQASSVQTFQSQIRQCRVHG